MKASIISALLVAGSYAMPAALQKRATFTDEVVVTVWTTTTVFVDPTASPAAFAERSSSSHHSRSSSSSSSSSSVPSTSSIAPVAAVVTPPPAVVTPPPAVVTPPPAPVYTPTPVAAAPAPATGGGLVSGAGEITFYDLTAGLTSCGQQYSNSDNVVALSYLDMNNGANSNHNSLCGKTITITLGSVTATGTVVDTCMGCASGNIDLSPALFDKFASESAGRVPGAKWVVN